MCIIHNIPSAVLIRNYDKTIQSKRVSFNDGQNHVVSISNSELDKSICMALNRLLQLVSNFQMPT